MVCYPIYFYFMTALLKFYCSFLASVRSFICWSVFRLWNLLGTIKRMYSIIYLILLVKCFLDWGKSASKVFMCACTVKINFDGGNNMKNYFKIFKLLRKTFRYHKWNCHLFQMKIQKRKRLHLCNQHLNFPNNHKKNHIISLSAPN